MYSSVLSACLLAASVWTVFSTVGSLDARGQDTRPLHLLDHIVSDADLIDLQSHRWVFKPVEGDLVDTVQPVRWGRWPGIIEQQAVLLTDGSWIAVEIIDRTSEVLRVRNRWLNLAEIPLNAIRAVVVTPAASLMEWITIQQQLEGIHGDDDVIWMRDKNRLSGILNWSAGSDRSPDSVSIQMPQGEVMIPWTELQSLAVSPALIGPIPENRNVTRIGLDDGTLLNAVRVEAQQTHVDIRILPLTEIRSFDPPGEFCQAIGYLGTDRLVKGFRVDHVEPSAFRFLPDSELQFDLGVNRSVFGSPMVVGYHQHAGIILRGLSLHSSSQVTYRWDQSPGRFIAEVRMASRKDHRSRLGNVNCKVLVAKRGELMPLKEFSLGRQPGMPDFVSVSVDITEAQLVVLLVEKGLMGQWGDEVYWLDARFSRN
jgi:hypothetical protein